MISNWMYKWKDVFERSICRTDNHPESTTSNKYTSILNLTWYDFLEQFTTILLLTKRNIFFFISNQQDQI